MSRPLTPFVSTDPRFAPAPTPQPEEREEPAELIDERDDERCRCVMAPGQELTGRELMTGRCSECGRRFV